MKSKRSRILLLIEAIAIFVLVLPFTIGTFIDGDPETSPAIVNFLKNGNTLIIPIYIVIIYSIVCVFISVADIKHGCESTVKMSLITEALAIVWFVLVFYLWIKWMNSPYVVNEGTSNSFLYVFIFLFLSVFSLLGLAVGFIIIDFSIRFRAFAYAVSLASKKENEKEPLLILGIVFSLIVPLVGQILLLVYEKEKQKYVIDQQIDN